MSSQLPDPVMPWPLIPSGTINLSQKQQESNWNTWKQAGLAKWPSPQYTFMQGEMYSLITYVFYELLFRLQKLLSNVPLKPPLSPPLLTILSSPLWGFNQDPKSTTQSWPHYWTQFYLSQLARYQVPLLSCCFSSNACLGIEILCTFPIRQHCSPRK